MTTNVWRDPTIARQVAKLVVTLAEAAADVLMPEEEMSDDAWTLVMQDASGMAQEALEPLEKWRNVTIRDHEHMRAKLVKLRHGVQAALDMLDEQLA